jgi:hypothetical protein
MDLTEVSFEDGKWMELPVEGALVLAVLSLLVLYQKVSYKRIRDELKFYIDAATVNETA